MKLPVVNHEDYFAKIGDNHKFPINKFDELAKYLIKKNNKMNKSFFSTIENDNSKFGSLTYKKIQTLEKYCKIQVELITGRHHQIRCNFSEIGYPILGDLKYGSKRSNKDGGIYLHSREIDFIHPVSKEKIKSIIGK